MDLPHSGGSSGESTPHPVIYLIYTPQEGGVVIITPQDLKKSKNMGAEIISITYL
jgi:hypothetical protein